MHPGIESTTSSAGSTAFSQKDFSSLSVKSAECQCSCFKRAFKSLLILWYDSKQHMLIFSEDKAHQGIHIQTRIWPKSETVAQVHTNAWTASQLLSANLQSEQYFEGQDYFKGTFPRKCNKTRNTIAISEGVYVWKPPRVKSYVKTLVHCESN